jgi:hypothetical protein
MAPHQGPEAAGKGQAQTEVNYMAEQCSWRPLPRLSQGNHYEDDESDGSDRNAHVGM